MKISARCDYACRAVLELAMHWPLKKPVQIETIAEEQKIPVKYLVHILLQLKGIGIVNSIRGKEGGYVLSKLPSRITIGKIIREMCGPLLDYGHKKTPFSSVWDKIEEEISKVIDNVTFEELANKIKTERKGLVYSI